MGTSISLNGVTYTIPAVGEDNWGSDVGNYLIALATGVLTKAGGSFTLTAEADFGATYGLKSAYFKSRGTVAAAGVVRLGNTETVSWRNAAGTADLALTVNASNWLQFGGVDLVDRTTAQTLTSKTIDADANTITNIEDADIKAGAAIARSKLASGTADHVLINDGSGVASSEAQLAISRGGTGQSTANSALNALLPTQSGNGGKVLQTDGSDTSWVLGATTSTQPPIGSIVAYNPGYYTDGSNGTFTVVGPAGNTVADVNTYLPANWRVCDGSALNDASSPIWNAAGRYLPNISDDRFLMGATAAGSAGGANTMAHTHSVPAHHHAMGTGADLAIAASGSHSHPAGTWAWSHTAGTAGTPRPYRGDNNTSSSDTPGSCPTATATHTHASSDFSGRIGLVTGGVDGNAAMTSGAASNDENRPSYLSTFYIVRVA